ncbi:2-C-methyl-D-erythritol 4-phosphate cytidylyltransferase [Halioglobus japonicus]|uniref:2-C-methyl-D-erythritol 4-phosphate cytidylyltransferase n=2 Tax=Halioglobus japonicus TaxID=930805 RepID=A0AAP8MI49_9GAMM|nr:2-C-methyl-D-erythritol 4-phosphate cytidylyltransferase [Halioglobus japonicus]PLW88149.1 2-C-methyl-D-erythritol 4-phosphate cytidylyltransferase [Halioglobus japonicus]
MGSDTPKQYLQVAGSTLLEHSVRALLAAPSVSSLTIALHPDDTRAQSLALLDDARIHTVVGGDERADSVLAALQDLSARAAPDDWVLVHDAARPGLAPADVERLIAAVTSTGNGGILAEPVVDTVKRSDAAGHVLTTLDRTQLWRAQTPQMFSLGALLQAMENAREAGLTVTDEASAMEYAGHRVALIQGAAANLKVTVPADLALVAWYLERRTDEEIL